jgi:hypothetical protein
MYLTALTQRDRVFDISTRWLVGHVEPQDARFLSEVFLVEQAITRPTTEEFLREVMKPFTRGSIEFQHLQTKGDVRKTIMRGVKDPSARAEDLFSKYRARSESFFPTTPADVRVVTADGGELISMIRLKRVFRIADKAKRRIVDRLEREIRSAAIGLGADEQFGPQSTAHLTERVCQGFSGGSLRFRHEDLRIDDVVGVKLIAEESQLQEIEKAIAVHPEVISVRRSKHTGMYNDVQLDVTLRAPEIGPTIDRLLRLDWSRSAERGVDPEELASDIPGYVETGANSFVVEIILTTPEELVESEFGRGLHENRILRQRFTPKLTSQSATNVGLSALYLMLVAVSPSVKVADVPITMSGRHLPDAIAGSIAHLFGLDLDRSPMWTANGGGF